MVATTLGRAEARRNPGQIVDEGSRPMSHADICNVEPVTADELREVLDAIRGDERWTLTMEGQQ